MDARTARRVDAVIAELIAETTRVGDERRKMFEEDRRLKDSTAKMRWDAFVYPAFIAVGLMGAGAAMLWALTKLLA